MRNSEDTSRVGARAFLACSSCLYCMELRAVGEFVMSCRLSYPDSALCPAFLFIGSGFSTGATSQWTPLAFGQQALLPNYRLCKKAQDYLSRTCISYRFILRIRNLPRPLIHLPDFAFFQRFLHFPVK